MEYDAIVVLVTAPSMGVAHQVAEVLLTKKLAAAVNIIPSIQSLYIWQGERQDNPEVLLLIKSRASLFESQLVPAIQAAHPYEVPAIVALPIVMGSQSYLDWIETETDPSNS